MFDVGFWELVILFGLGLMVLGPERMPKVAAKVGRWAGQAKRMASNLKDQMRDEIEPFESSMRSMDKEMRKDFSAMRPDVGETAKPESTDDTATDDAKSTPDESIAAESASTETAESNTKPDPDLNKPA